MNDTELLNDRLELEEQLACYRSGGEHLPLNFAAVKDACSMLHTDVLILLYMVAARSNGQILEIGPYLGGSTIALSTGVRDSNRLVTSIEAGEGFGHHDFPTKDIIADLKANLQRWSCAEAVRIVQGFSRDEPVVRSVLELLSPESVSVLFLDADGQPASDLEKYENLLQDGCYLLVDDFLSPGSDKGPSTRMQIEELCQAERLSPYGIYGWGTWMGRYWKTR